MANAINSFLSGLPDGIYDLFVDALGNITAVPVTTAGLAANAQSPAATVVPAVTVPATLAANNGKSDKYTGDSTLTQDGNVITQTAIKKPTESPAEHEFKLMTRPAVMGIAFALGGFGIPRIYQWYKTYRTVESLSSKPGLPKNPDDLLKQGYNETSHPDAAKNGHRTFENPDTGDKVRFDEGEPGAPGHEGNDHYHRYNPDSNGKVDQYLDKDGNAVPRGSDASHLYPGD